MLIRLAMPIALGGALFTCACGLVAPTANAAPPAVAQQQANPADAVIGVWKPSDMEVDIQINGANGQYQGVVVKAANPAMMNTVMLRGVAFDAGSNTWRGEIFAPKRNAFVPMTIRMKAANGFEMVAGSGIMSKTIEWVRLQ